jgi:O-antigen ligase
MPIRVLVCFLFVIGFSLYAYRNWFIGACGAVAVMALVEHPEMPRMMMGIPGCSPWNFLIFNVTIAWWRQRSIEGLVWDMPRNISMLLFFFIGTVFVSFVRLLINPTQYCPYDTAGIINEAFINSLKFMLPFYLFYDGCRTPERARGALVSILLLYLILGGLVVKHMGLHGVAAGEDLNGRGAKLIHAATGYHRVDMAMMLAGASWGMLACFNLVEQKKYKLVVFGAFLLLSVAEALTGGRTGYVTWCLIGFGLCVVRWRKLLLLMPVAVGIALVFMPAVTQRMSKGFAQNEGNIVTHDNEDEITSGRTEVWPFALRGIAASPIFGYGRFGFLRSGTAAVYAAAGVEEWVGHPHCAYLEMLLDNGVLGFLLVLPLYGVLVLYSLKLFLDPVDPLDSAIGGMALALFLALLIASVGAQTLYPRESASGMWAAAGLMLRRYVDRRQRQESEEETGETSGAYGTETGSSEPQPSFMNFHASH